MSINNINYVEIKNCKIEELHIRENTSNIDLSSTKKFWQIDSYLLAKFQNNLEGGNVDLGGLTIDNWKIRRRRIDSTQFKELGVVSTAIDDSFYYLDYTPRAGVTYEYTVTPMSGDIEGQPQTVQIEFNFDYWWLTDGIESYPFFLNLEVSDISTNQQRYVYEGFNEFPTVSYGNQQYQSGTITAILLDTFLETSYNYQKQVESFINNHKKKYMKNPNGDLFIVDTNSSKRKIYTELVENISAITFDWMEVAKIDVYE